MLLAVFSDVHANVPALAAVLKDIETRKTHKVICAGDLVGYAPYPNEVVDLVRGKAITCVTGNYDDAVGHDRFVCGCDYKDEKSQFLGTQSIGWTKQNTSEHSKEFLRRLPKELRIECSNYKVLVVHGSPRALNEYLFENTPDDYLNTLLQESNTDILICGHTHLPYHKALPNGHVINVGSVGKPKHGDPNALYALIDIKENGIEKNISVKFIKVPYDYEAVARAIENSELPDEFAVNIRTGKA